MSNWHIQDDVIENYLQACYEASMYHDKFNKFKQDERLTKIFEHTTRDIAINYIYDILKDNPRLLSNKKIYKDDIIGSPRMYDFGFAVCSSSLFQYLGVLSNLIVYFEDLSKLNIVEIGGGYGGQCKIIHDYFRPASYTIIDLPETCMLADKYLKTVGAKVDFIHPENIVNKEYDLVISNYSITEIREPLRTDYVNKILLNSEKGYLTCNRNVDLYSKLALLKHVITIPDIDGENEDNYIILWK